MLFTSRVLSRRICCFIWLVSLFVICFCCCCFCCCCCCFTSQNTLKGWHHLLSSLPYFLSNMTKLFVICADNETRRIFLVVLFFSFFVFVFVFLSFFVFYYYYYYFITEHTLIVNSAPLMVIFVGLKMQVGHIQIILYKIMWVWRYGILLLKRHNWMLLAHRP